MSETVNRYQAETIELGELLTVAELSLVLKVKKSWIYTHLEVIPHVRLGRYVRFEWQAVSEFLGRQRKNYSRPFRRP